MATDALIASASSPSPPPPAQSPWDHHSTHEYSSYAGSYGSASDWGQNDNDALATFGPDDGYNPTDFDASSPDYGSLNRSGANLNFFDHENLQPDVLADLDLPPGADQQQFVSLSLTPAEPGHKHHPPSPFVNPSDLSSPGSSPGSVHNAGDGPGRHSRHSSVGSYHSPRLHQPTLANYGPSPPTSPPEIKAMSPPALVIPSDPTGPSSHQSLSQSHLLPVTAGIDINIVPSTPISPGAAGQSVAFQTVLQNLNAAAAQATSSSTATRGSAIDQDPQQQHRQTSPAPLPAALAGSPRMPPASIMDSASPQVPMWNISPHGSPMPGLRHGLHLRNSSEDSVRVTHSPLQGSPNLPPAPFPRGADLATGLVNLSLGLNGGAQPFPSPQPSPNPNDMLIATTLRHHRSRSEASMNPPHWGPHAPQGSPAPGQMGQMFPPPDLGFGGLGLSGMPNSGMGGFPPGVSQTGAPPNGFAPLGFDMGHPASQPLGGVLPPFKMTPHSFDDSGDMLLPGIRRSRSDAGGHRRGVRSEDFSQYGLPSNGEGNDLLRSITTPDGALAPSDPRVSPSMRRRGSSRGSHERGSSISSGRPSPYPSPNASPRHPEEMLPMGLDGGLESSVSRPHVTTPATAVASNSRRKTEANFVCPVPGCGSTFTRHFNLKGHLRSHNEERPFKCKWPGCEKGFARQHDCKRHEALHLNIRPYTCDGCGKTFARMDALNRHLRSEGGVECRRLGDDGMDVNMSGLDQMNPAATGLHPLPLSAGNEWSHAGGLVL